MIKFKVIIKGAGEEFEPELIQNDECWYESIEYFYDGIYVDENSAILRMGVKIGDTWHFENNVYTDGHEKYYQLCSGIGGWILNQIGDGMPLNVGHINELEKIGHLWSKDKKIQELVKKYDPPVYSCLEMLGPFSEVME